MRVWGVLLLAVLSLGFLGGIYPAGSAPYRPVIVEQRVYGYEGQQMLVAVAQGYAVGVTGSPPYDGFFVLDTATGDADVVGLGAPFYLCGVAYDDAGNTVFLSLLAVGEKANRSLLAVINGPGNFAAYSLSGAGSCMSLGVSRDTVFLASAKSSGAGTGVSLVALDRKSMEATASTYVFPHIPLRLGALYVLKDKPVVALTGNSMVLFFSPWDKSVYAYNVTAHPRILAVSGRAALVADAEYSSIYLLLNIYSPGKAEVYEYSVPHPSPALSGSGAITGDYAVAAVSREKDTVVVAISLSSKHATYTWLSGGFRVASVEALGNNIILSGGGGMVAELSSIVADPPKPVAAAGIDIHVPVEEPAEAPEITAERPVSSPAAFRNGSVDEADAVALTLGMAELRNMVVVYPYDYMLVPFSEKASTAYMVLRVDDRLFNVTLSFNNNSFVARGVPAGDAEADIWMVERGMGEPYYMGSIEVKGYDGAYYSARFVRQTPYIINASASREKDVVEAILVNPGQRTWNTTIYAYLNGEKIYNKTLTLKPVYRRTIIIPYSGNGTMRIEVYVDKDHERLLTHIYTLNVVATHEAPPQGSGGNATSSQVPGQAGGAAGQQPSQVGGGSGGEAPSSGEGPPLALYAGLAAAAVVAVAAVYFFIIRRR